MLLLWRRCVLVGVVALVFSGLASGQTIYYDSGYTWRGYTGTVAPTCPSKRCHYFSMNVWDSVYQEFTAWKSVSGNPNSASAFVNFRVIFPPGYNINDTTKKYPMILMFHGAGESGRVWAGHYNYSPTDSTFDNNSHNLKLGGNEHRLAVVKPSFNPGSFPGIVVFPQASYNGVWGDTTSTVLSEHEKMLVGFIEDQLVARYHVDPNRIVAHGLSNGAKSVWAVAQKRPDLFAAILPMSGIPFNADKASTILLTTPIRLFQGGLDFNPTPGAAKQVINAFVAKGGNPQFILYPDLGHGTWNRAYRESDFFLWIRAQDKRNVFVFGGTKEICNNSIKLGFSANMLSYQWTKDGNNITGAQGRYLENVNAPGVYSVKFQRLNGQWDESFAVNVVQKTDCTPDRPVLAANLNAAVCSDMASGITLDDNGSSVNAATFNITAINFNGLAASAGTPQTGTGFYDIEILNDAYTNKSTVPVNVVYTVVPVSSAGYTGDPVNVTLTINPEPVLSPTLNATRCSDVPIGIMLNDDGSSVNAAAFNIPAINLNGLVASAGSPAVGTDLSQAVIQNDAYTNTGALPVDIIYTVVPVSSAGCSGNNTNVTVTVNPEPVLNGALNATVSSNVASGITLDDDGTGVNAASFNILTLHLNGLTAHAGAPAAGTGLGSNVIIDDAFTNTSDAIVNVIYTVVPVSAAGCLGDQVNVTLTVSPAPVLSGSLQVTRCSDVASAIMLDDDGSGVEAASFNITAIDFNGLVASAGSPSMGTGFSAGVISDDAFTNKTMQPVNVVYTIVPVSITGVQGSEVNVTFSVNPEPVLDPGLSVTQCSDVAAGINLDDNGMSVNAAAFNITSINFNGLIASAGSPATGTGLSSNILSNDAYTNKGALPVNVVYRIVPVSATGCPGNPVNVTVTINPEPLLSANLGAAVISGDASGIILDDSGTGVNAVEFNITEINTNGLAASAGSPVTGIGFGAAILSDDAFTNLSDLPVNVTYTVEPVSDAGCSGEPGVVTLTIDPIPLEPDPDEPDPDEPDPDEPNPDEPDPDEPDPDEPDPDEPDPDEPGPDEPGPDEPGPDDPDTDEPNPDEPDPDEPGPDEPDTDEPNPDEPAPDEPDQNEPNPDEPGPEQTITGDLTGIVFMTTVYPNPTKGRVAIGFSKAIQSVTIRVMTVTGQFIQIPAVQTSDSTIEADLTDLTPGLYIMRIHETGSVFRIFKN